MLKRKYITSANKIASYVDPTKAKNRKTIKKLISTRESIESEQTISNSGITTNREEEVSHNENVVEISNETDNFDTIQEPINEMLRGVDDNFYEEKEEEEEKSSSTEIFDSVLEFFLDHNLSLNALENLLKLVNKVIRIASVTNEICLPTSKYLLKKCIDARFHAQYHTKCSICQKYSVCKELNDQKKCVHCDSAYKADESNFFVYFPIRTQIEEIVGRNLEQILRYKTLVHNQPETKITDVQNARIYQENIKGDSNIPITFTFNTDGVSVFKSKKSSLWPIYLYINELPPEVRFKHDNILAVALSYECNNNNPNMSEITKPFIIEMQHLQSEDGCISLNYQNETKKIFPFLLSSCLDLKAQPLITTLTQYNGYYACSTCKQKGTSIKLSDDDSKIKQVRYTYSENQPMRSNIEVMKQMFEANEKEIAIEGIHGINPLVLVKHFKPVEGITVDYMHGCCLGLSRQLLNIYLSAKNKKEAYYLGSRIKEIDERLLNIKPPAYIKRKPRSIECRKHWKATEWKHWILFYAVPCLENILPELYLNHLKLFVSALHCLSGKAIDKRELPTIEKNLKQFVKLFEESFGESEMTMNVHKILHLVQMVKDSGPLWAFGAFGFESKNGQVVKFVKGSKDVLLQITSKCVFKRYLLSKQNRTYYRNDTTRLLGSKRTFLVSKNLKRYFDRSGFSIDGNRLEVFHRLLYKSSVLTCAEYKNAKKSIDSVVEMNDGCVGNIVFFFCDSQDKIHLVLLEYKKLKANVTEKKYLKRVKSTNVYKIYPIEMINKKCVFVSVNKKNNFVYDLPNDYECD